MTRKEIIDIIVSEMADATVIRYCLIYLKKEEENRKLLSHTLLAQNMIDEALALAIIKNWTADERVFFYTTPMAAGDGHMAHIGIDGRGLYEDSQPVDDSEYWALATALALAIRDNKFPIQEDVPDKEFDSNDEEIYELREKVRQLEHKLDVYDQQRVDVRKKLLSVRLPLEDLIRDTEQRKETW